MINPAPTAKITSDFGIRLINGKVNRHYGLDFGNKGNPFPVIAADDGRVVGVSRDGRVDKTPTIKTPANWVKIRHSNKLETWYWHLSKVNVVLGQKIIKGQPIGISGKTGWAYGVHLHLEVRKGGEAVDPRQYINFNNSPVENNDRNTIVVQAGWGLYDVLKAAGIKYLGTPTQDLEVLTQLYKLNKAFRGSWDWKSLNQRIQPGDKLTVKSTANATITLPEVKTEISVLQETIDSLQAQLEAKIATNQKIETARIHAEQLATDLQQAEAKLTTLETQQLKSENPELETFATHVVETTAKQIEEREVKLWWHTFVDEHISSEFLRQLFKYTWPAWLFLLISTTLAWVQMYKPGSGILSQLLVPLIPILVVFGSSVLQFLLTNYDKNKDGRIDISDFGIELPSLTTAQREALTGEVGMVVYDTTLGHLTDYNADKNRRIDGADLDT
jgi:hypothetical protein